MMSHQISCAHGQCSDPACGSEFVLVGNQRVDAADLIEKVEGGKIKLWTVNDGQPVSVVVNIGPDGRKRLICE